MPVVEQGKEYLNDHLNNEALLHMCTQSQETEHYTHRPQAHRRAHVGTLIWSLYLDACVHGAVVPGLTVARKQSCCYCALELLLCVCSSGNRASASAAFILCLGLTPRGEDDPLAIAITVVWCSPAPHASGPSSGPRAEAGGDGSSPQAGLNTGFSTGPVM